MSATKSSRWTACSRVVRARAEQTGASSTGALFAGVLLVELLIALLGSGLKAVSGDGAPYAPGPRTFGTPAYIGNLLLTRFLLVFEASSLLLLIAAVGGVVLARRRRGLDDDEERDRLTPLDILRPRGTGTMVEGVEGLALAHARGTGDFEDDEHPVQTEAAGEHRLVPRRLGDRLLHGRVRRDDAA